MNWKNQRRENTCTSSKQVIDVVVAQPVFIILALELPKSQFVIIPLPAVDTNMNFSIWGQQVSLGDTCSLTDITVLDE